MTLVRSFGLCVHIQRMGRPLGVALCDILIRLDTVVLSRYIVKSVRLYV